MSSVRFRPKRYGGKAGATFGDEREADHVSELD
jgi:hypothetical protein